MSADNPTDFIEWLRRGEFVLMDGAMGTELERRGVPIEGAGWSALAVRDQGEIIRQIHEDYIQAGARLHIVNSFALARHVLEPLGLGGEFAHLNRRAVELFDDALIRLGAARNAFWVAGSLSTFAAQSDRSLLPARDVLVSNYRDQALILGAAGVDLLAFEMLFDVDVSLAMLEAVAGIGLPLILGLTCEWRQGDGSDVVMTRGMGCPDARLEEILPEIIAAAEAQEVILSIMHSEADVTDAAIEILRRYWDGPVAIYPNSGRFVDLHMQFETVCGIAEFQRSARHWIDAGIQVVGGCCGIGPLHIQGLGRESYPGN